MKNAARIIGWICFVLASVVYLIATCWFGSGFVSAVADYNAGEPLGLATLLIVFAVFGSIVYAAVAFVSIIGAVVANVNRGDKKFFFAPIITLVLAVLTWIIFYLTGAFV